MKSYKNADYYLGVSINKKDGLANNTSLGAYVTWKKSTSFNVASLWHGGWATYPVTWSAQAYKS